MNRDKEKNIIREYYERGQSLLDYAVFLVIIIATFLIMGYYIRNSLSGRYRQAADVFGTGEVYAPNIEGVTVPSVITGKVETPRPK